jgi:Acetyltransferase (isoleucine patch superfamily)
MLKYFNKYILRFNLLKTIYINIKLLPIKDAIKFPILLFGKINLADLSGKITFTCPVKFGLVKFGTYDNNINGYKSGPSRLSILGCININGKTNFSSGIKIHVAKEGLLILGNNVNFNQNIRVFCTNRIVIGDNTAIAWDSQIFDTNFHYVIQNKTYTKRKNRAILIGRNVWIGNHVTIGSGTKINNKCIVASNSLVNKDYYSNGEECLYGGIPARLISRNVARLFDQEMEKMIDDYFIKNPEEDIYYFPYNHN